MVHDLPYIVMRRTSGMGNLLEAGEFKTVLDRTVKREIGSNYFNVT